MTVTMTIYEVAVLLIALGFVAFVIALIPSLVQMKKTLKSVEELTLEGKKTAEHLTDVLKKAEKQLDDAEELITSLKETGLKTVGIVDAVIENIKGPVFTGLGLLMGIEQALKHLFRKKKDGGEDNVKHEE